MTDRKGWLSRLFGGSRREVEAEIEKLKEQIEEARRELDERQRLIAENERMLQELDDRLRELEAEGGEEPGPRQYHSDNRPVEAKRGAHDVYR